MLKFYLPSVTITENASATKSYGLHVVYIEMIF